MSYWRKRDPDDPFERVVTYIPKGTLEILRKISNERCLPMSRLVSYAVDNELDCANPFNYPTELPTEPFVKFLRPKECAAILEFLKFLSGGLSRDMLLLCRRQMGIEDRKDFMIAYRELLELKSIEEVVPSRAKFTRFSADYRVTRVVGRKGGRRARYKRVEGESQNYKRVITDEDVER